MQHLASSVLTLLLALRLHRLAATRQSARLNARQSVRIVAQKLSARRLATRLSARKIVRKSAALKLSVRRAAATKLNSCKTTMTKGSINATFFCVEGYRFAQR